jgi:SpoVK/Ycf46/Vps4 family AAA+-type ATPase
MKYIISILLVLVILCVFYYLAYVAKIQESNAEGFVTGTTGISKICENFNGADLRNVCTEAGMFAIRENREYVIEEDFFKGA